jgi:hypothetical protein
MNIETAVASAAELAAQHPTDTGQFLLVVTFLVLLRMVQKAWDVMLTTKLPPQRGPAKHRKGKR